MILKQAYEFDTQAPPIFCQRYGDGHINDTYIVLDGAGREYILQRVNITVFKEPQKLMDNIISVTEHIKSKVGSPREVLTLVKAKTGKDWLVDDEQNWWRMYEFVCDSFSINNVESEEVFYSSGATFGNFQNQLADFPAHTLFETIPNFHNTPERYNQLTVAAGADSEKRLVDCSVEVEFASSRKDECSYLADQLAKGDIPLRVTHNDTKLNNILFDRWSKKALCVIDLDTVMPGLAAHDFGDSIRFGASTAAEDEVDLEKVKLSLPLFKAFARGFLSSAGNKLTEKEIDSLVWGAKLMTLECGMRFLADHLSGDVYFRIHRSGHNLDRCRTQFKLVQEMETHFETMKEIVKDAYAEFAKV